MRSINGRYGKGSYTTDVLSFRHAQKPRRRRHEPVDILHDDILARLKHAPYLDVTKGELRVAKEEELPTPELGYVILAVDYCKRMAKSRGMHTDEYLLACSAHALCHLAGMTHDTRAEYDAMRHAEQNGLNAVRACALGEGMRVPQSYLR